MRDVFDAVLYITRTGCQWRYLPADFPPKSTVWRYFNAWRKGGALDAIHDRLRKAARTAEKPYHPRTTASVDSQSVDDATAAPELFARLEGQPMGKVARMFADAKYHNFKLYEWVGEHASWDLEIVRRPEGKKGWVKLPIRWTVERTFECGHRVPVSQTGGSLIPPPAGLGASSSQALAASPVALPQGSPG